MDILPAILLAALAFGAWLAVGVARWLREFAAAPSIGVALHGLARWSLFCWFGAWSWTGALPPFVESSKLGLDARIYLAGAKAWLAGGDPWNTQVVFHDAGTYGFHFAAPPPAVLLGVPFAWLPEDIFAPLAILGSFAAGFYLLHVVRLPSWWILFPPLLIGILSGNPVVVGLACVVSGARWLAPVGFAAKIYFLAGIVAERRWKDVAVLAAFVAATVLILMPLWLQYAADYSAISARVAHESDGGLSASRSLPLFAATATFVAALALVDWRAACWLAVPALAPFAEFHACIFALPVIDPGLAVLLAIPGSPTYMIAPLAICAYSLWRVGRRAAEARGMKLPAILDVRIRGEGAADAEVPVGAISVLRGIARAARSG